MSSKSGSIASQSSRASELSFSSSQHLSESPASLVAEHLHTLTLHRHRTVCILLKICLAMMVAFIAEHCDVAG